MDLHDLNALSNAPRQRRSEALLLRILDAASRVLRRDGFEGLTIRAVAKESNVSHGGIYRRFADRDELLGAIHAQVLKRLEQRIVSRFRTTSWSSLTEVVSALVEEIATTFRADGDVFVGMKPRASDPALLEQSLATQRLIAAEFLKAAETFADAFGSSDREAAAEFALQLVLAVFTRRLIFPQSQGKNGDWSTLAQNVALAANAYLMSPPV